VDRDLLYDTGNERSYRTRSVSAGRSRLLLLYRDRERPLAVRYDVMVGYKEEREEFYRCRYRALDGFYEPVRTGHYRSERPTASELSRLLLFNTLDGSKSGSPAIRHH